MSPSEVMSGMDPLALPDGRPLTDAGQQPITHADLRQALAGAWAASERGEGDCFGQAPEGRGGGAVLPMNCLYFLFCVKSLYSLIFMAQINSTIIHYLPRFSVFFAHALYDFCH